MSPAPDYKRRDSSEQVAAPLPPPPAAHMIDLIPEDFPTSPPAPPYSHSEQGEVKDGALLPTDDLWAAPLHLSSSPGLWASNQEGYTSAACTIATPATASLCAPSGMPAAASLWSQVGGDVDALLEDDEEDLLL